MSSNRISLSIPADDLAQIQAAVKTLQDKLLPHLVDLSADELRALPKMGDKTLAFVFKALDYAHAHPTLFPSFLDMAEFERDVAGVQLLQNVLRPLTQIVDVADDSLALAGSEAYAAALAFYQSVKGAARSKVSGASTIADDLSVRFSGRRGAAAPASAAPASAAGNA